MKVEYRCRIFEPHHMKADELVHTIEVTIIDQSSVPSEGDAVMVADEYHEVEALVETVLWDFTQDDVEITVTLADTDTDGGPY